MNEERILKYICAKEYFILTDNEWNERIVAGCILLDECAKWTEPEANSKYIDYLVSAEAGAGQLFLEKIIKYCKENGVEKLKLDCQYHNEKLKNYYFRLGFKEVGKISHKYFPNRYSCLMCLELRKLS